MSEEAPVPPKRRAARKGQDEAAPASRPAATQKRQDKSTAAKPRGRGGQTPNPEFDPARLPFAIAALWRVFDLAVARAGRGDPAAGGKQWTVRLGDLPPSYRAAISGELKVSRAELNATGLYLEIKNVDLGDGA